MSKNRVLDKMKKDRKNAKAKAAKANLRQFNRFLKQLDRLTAQVPVVPATDSIVDNLRVIRHVIVAECAAERKNM